MRGGEEMSIEEEEITTADLSPPTTAGERTTLKKDREEIAKSSFPPTTATALGKEVTSKNKKVGYFEIFKVKDF